MSEPLYRRILLKLSGEILAGDKGFGIDPGKASYLANEVKSVHELGISIGLIIGAGNIFRGLSGAAAGMDRTSADYMGMLATVMNSLAMQNSLERLGFQTRIQSAISMTEVCETYTRRRAIRHMEKNRIVIFAAGTGNPYFTTDTAAALRASEMECDAIFKGTKVDGIYNKDPIKYSEAIKFKKITYGEVLSKNLRVLDSSAVSLARDNNIPIIVFSIKEDNGFLNILKGKGSCSVVEG